MTGCSKAGLQSMPSRNALKECSHKVSMTSKYALKEYKVYKKTNNAFKCMTSKYAFKEYKVYKKTNNAFKQYMMLVVQLYRMCSL